MTDMLLARPGTGEAKGQTQVLEAKPGCFFRKSHSSPEPLLSKDHLPYPSYVEILLHSGFSWARSVHFWNCPCPPRLHPSKEVLTINAGRNRFGSIRFGSVIFENSSFGFLFRPVPKLKGSVRFGRFDSVSYSFLSMPFSRYLCCRRKRRPSWTRSPPSPWSLPPRRTPRLTLPAWPPARPPRRRRRCSAPIEHLML